MWGGEDGMTVFQLPGPLLNLSTNVVLIYVPLVFQFPVLRYKSFLPVGSKLPVLAVYMLSFAIHYLKLGAPYVVGL